MQVVIPARAGSKGIIGKNTALVGGKPLIAHQIEKALRLPEGDVVVSTNDPTVLAIARRYPCRIHERERYVDDEATIDEFARWWVREHGESLLVQPTSWGWDPLEAVKMMERAGEVGHNLTMVGRVEGLFWGDKTLITERRNRQEMRRALHREVGVRALVNDWDSYQPWVMESGTVIDIDHPDDLELVKRVQRRLNIEFRPIVGVKYGMGHLSRCLALATEMQHHEIKVHTQAEDVLENYRQLIPERWRMTWPNSPDVVVLDELDTTREEVAKLQSWGAKVVTLEDRGEGAGLADLVISDMYPSGRDTRRELVGSKWAVMRPEFAGVEVEAPTEVRKVLVTFGGTDPARVTEKVLAIGDTINDMAQVWVIPPPGREVEDWGPSEFGIWDGSVAEAMLQCDVVVTSGGRTLLEAAAMNRPAIVALQNSREGEHMHLWKGNVVAGHGQDPRIAQMIAGTIAMWREVPERMADLLETRPRIDGQGTARVAREIEGLR